MRSIRLVPWAHALGWLAAGLVYFLTVLPFYGGALPKLALFKVGWSIVGWLLAEGLLRFYRRVGVALRSPPAAATTVLLASALVAALWVGVMAAVSIAAQGNTLLFFTPSFFPFVLMNHVFILIAWSGGWLALVFWRRSQAEEKRALAAVSDARSAQLELLRLQLSPHFLFNSLASLRALIAEDPDDARRMVTRLSGFLRYALATRDRTWSTVREELEVLGAYLEIERIRFGDRLRVVVDAQPDAAPLPIPSLLLLALVENAVKHGAERDGVLDIAVHAGRTGGALHLVVRNTGTLQDDSGNGTGIGLRNVRERLDSAYPGRGAGLRLTAADGTVEARIVIERPDAAVDAAAATREST